MGCLGIVSPIPWVWAHVDLLEGLRCGCNSTVESSKASKHLENDEQQIECHINSKPFVLLVEYVLMADLNRILVKGQYHYSNHSLAEEEVLL